MADPTFTLKEKLTLELRTKSHEHQTSNPWNANRCEGYMDALHYVIKLIDLEGENNETIQKQYKEGTQAA